MKRYQDHRFAGSHQWLSFLVATCLSLPLPALAGSVALATSPLATSTSSSVKPNVLLVLDNSGSMSWDHMPDDSSDPGSSVVFSYGYYGLRSSQCNQVYYDPAVTYLAPLNAAGGSYAYAPSFTSARQNGYDSGSTAVNLNSSFRASLSMSTDSSDQAAYYFTYSGTQTTPELKNYHSTSNTFYNECHSAQNVSPGQDVFTKVVMTNSATSTTAKLTLSCSSCNNTAVTSIKIDGVELMSSPPSTSTTNTSTAASSIAGKITLNGFSATVSSNVVTIGGVPDTASKIVVSYTVTGTPMSFSPTIYLKADTNKLQNFANWYSFYRTRMAMMKTATGRAFSTLGDRYRVGLMNYSASSTPLVEVGTFEGTTSGGKRYTWYDELYSLPASGSTPSRTALSNAGRYFAGKLSGTDPVQYSCQQNFAILASDGYWNTGDGFQLDGSTAVGNQDKSADRPIYDGAIDAGTSTVTLNYTRNSYFCTSSGCSTGRRIRTTPQTGSCTVTVTGSPSGTEACNPSTWTNGSASNGTCSYSSSTACGNALPSPNPSTKVESSRVVTTNTTGGSSNSLSDVAMYYYQTDLRAQALNNCGTPISPATVGPLCENNVFKSGVDQNQQQHMTTFTLGLGASGLMKYSSGYESGGSADYTAVKLGSTVSASVCTWQTTVGEVCNWPVPGISSGNGFIANIDDLWHAAVNGRGAYFSATSPTSLSAGLSGALAGIGTALGSAAAAATSTLNPTAESNYAYVASYTTVDWTGNLERRGINTETGVVNKNADWCEEDVLPGTCNTADTNVTTTLVSETDGDTTTWYCVKAEQASCPDGVLESNGNCKVRVATSCTGIMRSLVGDTTDTRTIKTSNGTTLIDFKVDATANPDFGTIYSSYFASGNISTLSQWTTLNASQQTAAQGSNLVNYLRGQKGYEDRTSNTIVANRLFRARKSTLGDALESQPAYLAKPVFNYAYPGYSDFLSSNSSRAGNVYMGTNDGMMHAFAADTGVERWAYVPSMVIPSLWKLADNNYATLHANFVNGSPTTTDICVAGCTSALTAVWKTILIAGLNGGGRGYYALDITIPTSPVLLWEFKATGVLPVTSGSKTITDDDIGYSFGQPIVTRKGDGTWVVLVTSGYNNTSPGDGKGYLYVLNAGSGAIISKISTTIGSTTTPSGLAKIAGWNNDTLTGNEVGYVYGGDLSGNLWRFDINDNATNATIGKGSVLKLAALSNSSGTAQPITTTPILGKIAGKRIIFVGTGKYLETGDLTNTQTQSVYAIKDDDATSTLTNPRSSLVQQSLTNTTSGTRTGSTNAVNFFTGRGWYLDLPDSGERVNIDMKLVQGTLLIPSLVATNTACSPGGYGWLNFVNYMTGGVVNPANNLTGTKYDATIVGVNVLFISGKPIVEVVTSSNPTPEKNEAVEFSGASAGFTGKRVTWRELIQ